MNAVDRPEWPHLGLRQLPDPNLLRSIAQKVRLAVMGDQDKRDALDLDRLCELGGFRVEETFLHAPEGRLQALLFPGGANSFNVYVDARPPGGDQLIPAELAAELHAHRLRFRICHEVAHSFFFDRDGERPTAIVGTSAAQEEACDRFASELLIPRDRVRALAPDATSIVEIQRRFEVSLEAAARAFADVHRNAVVALYLDEPREARLQWSNHPERADDLLVSARSEARLERRRQRVLVGSLTKTAEGRGGSRARRSFEAL